MKGRNERKRAEFAARQVLERAWDKAAATCRGNSSKLDPVHVPASGNLEFWPDKPCHATCMLCGGLISRDWVFDRTGAVVGTYHWKLQPYVIEAL